MTTKTPEQIQALKDNWIKDPCWDIEDTEGFEAHHDELLKWREDLEVKHQLAANAREELRLEKIKKELGITHRETALALQTIAETENDLMRIERHVKSDQSTLDVSIAQVRATLLLAAQIKRVGDILESHFENTEADNNLDFNTRLFAKE